MADWKTYSQNRCQSRIRVNRTGSSLDDPDQDFYEDYAGGSLRNHTDYCDPALAKEFDA
jgi:peptide/nickel transport system substrate-binding protein